MYQIRYYDCWGNPYSPVHVFNLKSAEITNVNEYKNSEVTNITNSDANIEIYPNPFLSYVTIKFSGDTSPLKYSIIDLNGKVVLQNKTSSSSETINMSGLAAGTYVINAKAGEYNLVQKLIKK